MNEFGQTVSLFMIVKNERHVLRRCLESVRPLIDHWTIVDTGSTDGTQELARECLHQLPGALVERPWKDFGHNRSESVALARGSADYLLTLDADEYLVPDPDFMWPHLQSDAYSFVVNSGAVLYTRIQLVRAQLPWRYEGVLHEYPTCDRIYSHESLGGIKTIRLLEGARSRDPLTYRRDADVLERALCQDPGNPRNMFYLAQSYRDAQEPELALDRYLQRSRMDGFPEEVWCSLYEAAKLMEAKGRDWPTVQHAYLQAYRYRPVRAEPLYRIGVAFCGQHNFDEAIRYLGHGMNLPEPTGEQLFVESDVYRFLLPLEYAVACYWLGRHSKAISVIDCLLEDESLSADRTALLLRNRQHSLRALESGPSTELE